MSAAARPDCRLGDPLDLLSIAMNLGAEGSYDADIRRQKRRCTLTNKMKASGRQRSLPIQVI
jgi:hypothetical protein